ncbi:MAG: hypothetical protein R3345_01020 [Fulvivirga sp.]|nr:hypothetical protein [Fulvivirga sp.]
MKNILTIVLSLLALNAFSQVQHNFRMGSSNTTCDSLNLELAAISPDSAIAAIEQATYRFQQNMTISRYRSPRKLHYFSCDGKQGFLIAEENDSTRALYSHVPKTLWDQFTTTDDPIELYHSSNLKKYRSKNKQD